MNLANERHPCASGKPRGPSSDDLLLYGIASHFGRHIRNERNVEPIILISRLCSDQSSASVQVTTPRSDAVSSSESNSTYPGGGDTHAASPALQFLNSLRTEVAIQGRLSTFSNWPSITPSGEDMANAGWWYTNIADRVICPHCDTVLHRWTETDRPYDIHRRKSPQCAFVRATENAGLSTVRQRVSRTMTSTAKYVHKNGSVVQAIHAEYALVHRRRDTFDRMPESDRQCIPSVDTFVDAGFFFTGEKTTVRCFYCNGALRNWHTVDDPRVEHARWFPKCAYIRQLVGENLFQAIQRKSRELLGRTQRSPGTCISIRSI